MNLMTRLLMIGLGLVGLHTTGAFAQTAATESPGAKDYVILPVPPAEEKSAGRNTLVDRTVKNPQGKTVGTLEKLVMDSRTGKIEYGVVALAESGRLIPLNWSDLKVNRENGRVGLNVTQDELKHSLGHGDAKDLSPDLWEYFDDIVRKPGHQR